MANCLNLNGSSSGKYIIGDGVTMFVNGDGGTAVSCITPPDIVLKGLLSNVPDDGATYAFDAILAAGDTSVRVTNSLIE